MDLPGADLQEAGVLIETMKIHVGGEFEDKGQ